MLVTQRWWELKSRYLSVYVTDEVSVFSMCTAQSREGKAIAFDLLLGGFDVLVYVVSINP